MNIWSYLVGIVGVLLIVDNLIDAFQGVRPTRSTWKKWALFNWRELARVAAGLFIALIVAPIW